MSNPAPLNPDQLSAFLSGRLSWDEIGSVLKQLETHPEAESLLTDAARSGDADSFLAKLRSSLPGAAYQAEPELAGALQQSDRLISEVSTSSNMHSDGPTVMVNPPVVPQAEKLREYVLGRKLGEGGMGSVYEAVHERLGKTVAIKLLPSDRMNRPDLVSRFEREMKAVGRLDHPNIVRATDAGCIDGKLFLVMEHVAGVDLSTLIHRHGPLSVADACEVIRQAADALDHAHAHGLIHRDIKPSNLMLTRDGVVKLLDLGLARLRDESDEAPGAGSELTQVGQVMGTLDYLSPEQASGRQDLDARADLYSLGCAFYKLLSGHAVFEGPEFGSLLAKLAAHTQREPVSLRQWRPDVPVEVEQIVMRLMAKDRNARFPTAAEVAAAVVPFAVGSQLANLVAPMIPGGATDGRTRPGTLVSGPLPTAQPSTVLPSSVTDVRATRTRRRTGWLVALGVLLAGGYFLGQYIVRIKDRDGNVIAEVKVDSPPQVEIAPVTGSAPAAISPSSSTPAATVSAAIWQPTPEQRAFFDNVAKLPPEQQVEAVRQKLMEINPGFDGTNVSHRIDRGNVVQFGYVSTAPEIDIWPIRALSRLKELSCSTPGSQGKRGVRDLSPLAGLPLTYLDCNNTNVSDLSPLAGMQLGYLNCNQTNVIDLTPLKGMPLGNLACGFTEVSDLSPLEGMPLRSLACHNSNISDLSPLKRLLLTALDCSSTNVSDLSSLKGLPLKNLWCGYTQVSDLSPLKGMPLVSLYCGHTPITDLSSLEGMPLTHLNVDGTKVIDLSPLKGMPLTSLVCRHTQVTDLSPLKGMPLTSLECGVTKVSDLSPLEGMPLKVCGLSWSPVTDLSPLADCPLEFLTCSGIQSQHLLPLKNTPLQFFKFDLLLFHEPDEKIVRQFPLTRISWRPEDEISLNSGMPVEAFWQEVAERRRATAEFVAQVEPLSSRERLEAVEKRLRELNPNYKQPLGRTFRDGRVHSVHLIIDDVTDITPLRALTDLRELTLTNQKPPTPFDQPTFSDLSPLNTLPLEELNCDGWLVERNRAVLEGMATLKQINGQPTAPQ